MNPSKIYLSRNDLLNIIEVLDENKVNEFELIYESGSGIGYMVAIEFGYEINNRHVTVRVNTTDEGTW